MMRQPLIFDQVKKEGRWILDVLESKKLLQQIEMPMVETRLSETKKPQKAYIENWN